MAVVANKRSVMTLYSGSTDPYSHRARIVLAEKGVTFDLYEIDEENQPELLAEINPYSSVPTLVDRDLVLYESEIIMEYLDERFPHPPLLPVYPVARAESRLYIHRIEKDWGSLAKTILTSDDVDEVDAARQELQDGLIAIAPIFAEKDYFMSEEFTLVDCCLAPLLWRLPMLGIELPAQAKPLQQYMDRLFSRESFVESLSETEKEMR